MLVISRKQDESVMIGNNIEVVVIDIIGDKVRLGIVVPPEIPVNSKEAYAALKAQEYRDKK